MLNSPINTTKPRIRFPAREKSKCPPRLARDRWVLALQGLGGWGWALGFGTLGSDSQKSSQRQGGCTWERLPRHALPLDNSRIFTSTEVETELPRVSKIVLQKRGNNAPLKINPINPAPIRGCQRLQGLGGRGTA